jgi:hypothetical protein
MFYSKKCNANEKMYEIALNYKGIMDDVMITILLFLSKNKYGNAMNELGLYFESIKDYDSMMIYYLMACKYGTTDGLQKFINNNPK